MGIPMSPLDVPMDFYLYSNGFLWVFLWMPMGMLLDSSGYSNSYLFVFKRMPMCSRVERGNLEWNRVRVESKEE